MREAFAPIYHRTAASGQIVSVLDTACAKVAIGQGATPASIEDATRRIQNLTSEIDSLEREQVTGAEHEERLDELKARRTATEEELAKLNEQWEKEKGLTEQIRNIRLKARNVAAMTGKLCSNRSGGESMAASPETVVRHGRNRGGGNRRRSGTEPATATAPAADKPVDTEFLKAELKRLNAELKNSGRRSADAAGRKRPDRCRSNFRLDRNSDRQNGCR